MFLRNSTENTRESILQWVKDAMSSSSVQLLVFVYNKLVIVIAGFTLFTKTVFERPK